MGAQNPLYPTPLDQAHWQMDKVTAILAWWGAAIATAVLAWDIYKWKRTGRPKLNVSVSTNMQMAGSSNPQKYLVFRVTNNGDKPTTLAVITYRFYESKPSRWRTSRSKGRGLFNPGNATTPLPYKLEVGEVWSGTAFQTPDIEKMAREGYLYIEVEDSSTLNFKKNARVRLLVD